MNKQSTWGLAIASAVALCAGVSMWWWFQSKGPDPFQAVGDPTFELKRYESIETDVGKVPDLKEGYSLYTNGKLNFSVQYPSHYIPNEVQETAISDSVTFSPVGGGTGAQVFVVYYPKETIDEERFKMDVPTGARENIAPTTLGGSTAVQFESMHTGVGKTYEVWAIHGNYLYEVNVPILDKKILDEMVQSWQFLH